MLIGIEQGGMAMKHRGRLMGCLCVLLVLGACLYASRCCPEVTEYALTCERLPEAFDGYRIVQLSDLHAARFGPDNRRLVELTAAQAPDMIALTGDLIETEADIPVVRRLVEQLVPLAPVYVCSGNHDWAGGGAPALRQAVEAAGACWLGEDWVTLDRDGASIVIAGVEDPNSYADLITPDVFLEQTAQSRPDTFTILLGHRNDWPVKYPDLPVDLILSGHGHGGIVRLPFVGGLLGTDHQFFPEYGAGLYPSGRYVMAVSRGLGSTGPIPRLFNRPEVLCLTLHIPEK